MSRTRLINQKLKNMNIQKRLLASLAVLVVTFGLDALVYGNLLNDFFSGSCSREMPDFMWLTIGLIIYSYMFCYIYSKIKWSGSKTQSGIRFGIWVTLFMAVPINSIMMATTNCVSMNQAMVDTGYRLVATVLIGVIAAHILNHPEEIIDVQPSGPVVKTDPD